MLNFRASIFIVGILIINLSACKKRKVLKENKKSPIEKTNLQPPPPTGENKEDNSSNPPIQTSKTENESSKEDNIVKLNGTVKLNNCSGSLIRLKNQPLDQEAYVLTNGHCFMGPKLSFNKYIFNEDLNIAMKVFNIDNNFIEVKGYKLVFATMTRTDIAIIKINKTYHELIDLGVEPITLSSSLPQKNDPIFLLSSYWKLECESRIDSIIPTLKEDEWLFKNSIKYDMKHCKIIGGTSGSPLINISSQEQVGIHNTHNENGKECLINNPCEIDQNGKISIDHNISYGQQTSLIYDCLDFNYQITKDSLNQDRCLLIEKL